LLRSAANLFRAQGYHATGLNQLVAEGGAPKGSLYFHFPGGKEQLAAESVRLSGEEVGGTLEAALAGVTEPASAVTLVLDRLGDELAASGYRRGCPVASVALDVAADSEPVREACAAVYDGWQAAIAGRLRTAGLPDPDGLAALVLSAVEGALLLARTRRDLAPLHAVRDHLTALLTAAPLHR